MADLVSSRKAPEDIDYDNPESRNKFLSEAYPGINPNGKELFDGLCEAYRRAFLRVSDEKKYIEQQRRRMALMAPPTVNEVYRKATEVGELIAHTEGFKEGFVLDEENEKVFDLLCMYFANDKRFEEQGIDGIKYSLNKGIWLQSSTRGTGKSVMLRCFQHNKRMCFAYKHISELCNLYQKSGYDKLDFFINTIPQVSSQLNYWQKEAGVMFDEMFDDGLVNHMGTPMMVSKYIITTLYDSSRNFKGEFWKFHITSNFSGDDIEQKFGKTVRSRMPEMFNLIKLEGKNRRG
jgi:hypothetical protein